MRVLARRVHSVASAGRLRTGEQRAASMLHAARVGTVLTLLSDGEKADLGAFPKPRGKPWCRGSRTIRPA